MAEPSSFHPAASVPSSYWPSASPGEAVPPHFSLTLAQFSGSSQDRLGGGRINEARARVVHLARRS